MPSGHYLKYNQLNLKIYTSTTTKEIHIINKNVHKFGEYQKRSVLTSNTPKINLYNNLVIYLNLPLTKFTPHSAHYHTHIYTSHYFDTLESMPEWTLCIIFPPHTVYIFSVVPLRLHIQYVVATARLPYSHI